MLDVQGKQQKIAHKFVFSMHAVIVLLWRINTCVAIPDLLRYQVPMPGFQFLFLKNYFRDYRLIESISSADCKFCSVQMKEIDSR